jgi:hypothetical protein
MLLSVGKILAQMVSLHYGPPFSGQRWLRSIVLLSRHEILAEIYEGPLTPLQYCAAIWSLASERLLNAGRTAYAVVAHPTYKIASASDLVAVGLPIQPNTPTLAKLIGFHPPATGVT